MEIDKNLLKLNLTIPNPPDPVGTYVAYKKISNLLFISGQISIDDKGKITKGKLGKDLSIEEGKLPLATFCPVALIKPLESIINPPISSILFFGSIILALIKYFSFISFFYKKFLNMPF